LLLVGLTFTYLSKMQGHSNVKLSKNFGETKIHVHVQYEDGGSKLLRNEVTYLLTVRRHIQVIHTATADRTPISLKCEVPPQGRPEDTEC